MPLFYQCRRCTACCRWPGQVRVSKEEIPRLAVFHGLRETEFIQRYTRLTQERDGLALLENPDGTCIYLAGNDCLVQAAKPQQCRGFPNLWSFPGFEKSCRAVTRVVTEVEYWQLTGKMPGSRPAA